MARKEGFTLIELLLSVLVIGVLTAVIVVIINPAKIRSKTRDAQRIQDLKAIQSALEVYFADAGRYPASSGGTWEATYYSGTGLKTALSSGSPPYLRSIPNDPLQTTTPPSSPCGSNTVYRYNYRSVSGTGIEYVLTANLENTNVYPGTACASINNWSWASCGTPTPNCYAVQNPD